MTIITSKSLITNNYFRKWENFDPPFLSPAFKQEQESNEVYTPSFDHKNDIDFRKQSPISLMNHFKDVSAQKTAEPPYLRKRRNKFKQRQDPYVGHLMVNNEGQQVLQPLYSTGTRGVSLPPPITLGKHYNDYCGEEEEDKENMAPIQYYPTCHCQQYHANMYYNPHGYYYAPASVYFSPRSEESDEHVNKRNRKHRRKSRG